VTRAKTSKLFQFLCHHQCNIIMVSSDRIDLSISKSVLKTMFFGTGVLVTKMVVTNFYSMFTTISSGHAPPEDSKLLKMLGGPEEQHHGALKRSIEAHSIQLEASRLRASRVVMNDLENIPVALVVFWMAALANKKESAKIANLFIVFVGSRCLFSIAYLAGLPYARRAIFAIGLFSTARAMILGGQACSE